VYLSLSSSKIADAMFNVFRKMDFLWFYLDLRRMVLFGDECVWVVKLGCEFGFC